MSLAWFMPVTSSALLIFLNRRLFMSKRTKVCVAVVAFAAAAAALHFHLLEGESPFQILEGFLAVLILL